jgi:hypothetical protein
VTRAVPAWVPRATKAGLPWATPLPSPLMAPLPPLSLLLSFLLGRRTHFLRDGVLRFPTTLALQVNSTVAKSPSATTLGQVASAVGVRLRTESVAGALARVLNFTQGALGPHEDLTTWPIGTLASADTGPLTVPGASWSAAVLGAQLSG